MSNYTRKLKRIGQRKQARAESLLWTPEDYRAYYEARAKLLNLGTPREAASRRAWLAVREGIEREQDAVTD